MLSVCDEFVHLVLFTISFISIQFNYYMHWLCSRMFTFITTLIVFTQTNAHSRTLVKFKWFLQKKKMFSKSVKHYFKTFKLIIICAFESWTAKILKWSHCWYYLVVCWLFDLISNQIQCQILSMFSLSSNQKFRFLLKLFDLNCGLDDKAHGQ